LVRSGFKVASALLHGETYVVVRTKARAAGEIRGPVTAVATRSLPPAASGTGGSTAVCTPSPCVAGSMPDFWSSITVDDGSGTKTKTMAYKIYRPRNLTNSAANKVPLVVWLDEQLGPSAIANWENLATAGRFVLAVYRPGSYRFPRTTAALYFGPVTIPWQPIPIPNCGAAGAGNCDDKPGLIHFLKFAIQDQNVDPQKVFVTGASKGGSFVVELMCSPGTNGLFRGFGIVSASLYNPGSTRDATRNTCRSFNRDSSVVFEAGQSDSFISYQGLGREGHYQWGQQEGAGFVAGGYGCSARPTTTYFGNAGTLRRDVYSGCPMKNRAVGLISVPGGGHAYNIDGVQGLNSEAQIWNFWVSH
jgi:poly(3-hydroxybutyrate) depolymerase